MLEMLEELMVRAILRGGRSAAARGPIVSFHAHPERPESGVLPPTCSREPASSSFGAERFWWEPSMRTGSEQFMLEHWWWGAVDGRGTTWAASERFN